MMLNIIDAIIIILYLGVIIAIGIAFRGKQETAEDYFTGRGGLSRIFNSIIVGLSIAATFFSGLSFLVYPSIGYSNGIAILAGLLTFPVIWVILHFWFLPIYLSAGCRHPYDFIEDQLGSLVRTIAASMFMLLRIGWMGAMLYTPTIAFMTMAGLEPYWFWPVVLILGLSCTFYTTLGGIRGVIVTDAIQMSIIIISVAFLVIHVFSHLRVPVDRAISVLLKSGRLKLINPPIDPRETFSTLSILIGMAVSSLALYMSDQMSLQRYLSVDSLKSASRSFALNILGVIIIIVLLILIGLSLFVWYQFVPEENLPTLPDKIMPYFIATRLPVGISGLLLAAILAPTISSMTSGINAMAATITFDFRFHSKISASSKQQLRYGKIVSLVVGLIATVVAGLVEKLGTIFDITQTILGLFLGPLLTCIFLAVLNGGIKATQDVIIISIVLGLASGLLVLYLALSPLLVAPVTFTVSLVSCLTISGIFGSKTLHSRNYI